MGRLSLAFGLGVGYVLGARAGRARYGQITEAAAGVMERPEVQRALDRARTAVPAPLRSSIDRLSGRGSDRRGTSAEPIDAGAVVRDDLDVVTPPPPESGTGSSGTAASLPDPLIPPAKSGDDPIARQ